jgi:DnaJ domain
MFEKSLQLYPLPGVEALLAHAKTKKNSNNNNQNGRETSTGSNSSRGTTNGSSNTAARRSSSTSETTQQTQQNGSDGRAYTNEQVLIVKKVLSSKEGGRGAHYRVLDISNTASENDIKKAYRKLSLKVHPDKVRFVYSVCFITD